jgi:hypothetical protein
MQPLQQTYIVPDTVHVQFLREHTWHILGIQATVHMCISLHKLLERSWGNNYFKGNIARTSFRMLLHLRTRIFYFLLHLCHDTTYSVCYGISMHNKISELFFIHRFDAVETSFSFFSFGWQNFCS